MSALRQISSAKAAGLSDMIGSSEGVSVCISNRLLCADDDLAASGSHSIVTCHASYMAMAMGMG